MLAHKTTRDKGLCVWLASGPPWEGAFLRLDVSLRTHTSDFFFFNYQVIRTDDTLERGKA